MSNSSKQYILIDDDKLIHMSWKYHFKEKEEELFCFFTVEECLSKFNGEDLAHTTVFIDSNLAHGVKGEVEAKKLFDSGFLKIYLSTGYSPNSINKPAYIKEIISKKVPDFI